MKPSRIGDILKVMLNTLVLVTSGVGSIVNLAHGNSLPFALCLIVVVIFLVVIVSELRRTAAGDPSAHPAQPVAPRPCPPPPRATRPPVVTAAPAFSIRPGEPMILRVVRMDQPSHEHAGNTPA